MGVFQDCLRTVSPHAKIVLFAQQIITSGGVTYKNEPWHRECFTCSNCSTSLAGQRFTSRDEKPYCGDCFGELFAKRCTSCVKPITGKFAAGLAPGLRVHPKRESNCVWIFVLPHTFQKSLIAKKKNNSTLPTSLLCVLKFILF